jgi:glucose-6-phosphate isomerase
MLIQEESTGHCYAADLTPSQVVYVPGHTAHRTVNTGVEPLVYWGVLSCDAGHDYEYVRQNPFRQVVIQVEGSPVVMDREEYRQRLREASA